MSGPTAFKINDPKKKKVSLMDKFNKVKDSIKENVGAVVEGYKLTKVQDEEIAAKLKAKKKLAKKKKAVIVLPKKTNTVKNAIKDMYTPDWSTASGVNADYDRQ